MLNIKFNKTSKFWVLVLCLLVSFFAGALGSVATIANIPTWYSSLAKPPLLPPNWVFGPVWTVLYALIGVALYHVAVAKTKKSKDQAYWWFGAQLVLNIIWSFVFFGAHMAWPGFFVLLLLLGAIIATAFKFLPISKCAAYLLWPYAVWVCFAGYLNLGVALLN